jgi:hypothetical protein
MERKRADAASRVKAWTRNRFGDVTILVTELESAVPGFPPLHTVVAFWTAERKHYHFKVSMRAVNSPGQARAAFWSAEQRRRHHDC